MADNADNAGSLPGDPQAPAPIPQGAVGDSDVYQGKSTDEVVAMHKSLETKLSEQGGELGQLRDFVGRVGMFFKVDGENVTLNDDMVKRYAEVQGWLKPQSEPGNSTVPGSQTPTSNGDGPVFEKEESNSIRDMIKDEIRDAFKTSVEPLQQQFHQSQHSQWIDQARSSYTDFDTFRPKIAEFMNKTGYQVNNVEDLKNAYKAVKALSGELVDRKESEAHVAELQKTLQTLRPGAGGGPIKPQTEMSNAELMGLETVDSPEKKAFEALTGKPYYRP